jgi:glycine cleavage system H lipoate-binding protein
MNKNGDTATMRSKQRLCIWMQAGVVRHKRCRLDFQCPACHFDKAMQQIAFENKKIIRAGRSPGGRKGQIEFWKDKLRRLPQTRQPCLHHMKGRIDFRSCTHNYHCGNCDFEQYFNDQYTVHAAVRPVDVLDIHGVKAPQGYYLHRGHAWARIEEGTSVRIGIDDFALRMLGPLDRIDMPLIGKEVKQGQAGIALHRGRHTARVVFPVSGVVTACNMRVNENGHLANQDPYTNGWVLQVHAGNLRDDIKNLMLKDETRDFLSEEIDRLYEVIEETAGPLSADGGQLGDDIFGNLPALGWKRLSRLFLLA